MNSRIPQAFIDDLLTRTDLVRVINERVKLKKAGKNYTACCPFHQEKTPSFTVNPDKQFYYCFGCGASGNAIGFVMDHDRKGFREAVETLATDVGLSVPSSDDQNKLDVLTPLFQVMSRANQFYQEQLAHPEKGRDARHYLRNRQLSKDICQAYAIGFAPDGWDTLTTYFDDPSVTPALLNSGLCVQKKPPRVYDRFRGRIMFPIRDPRGRTIGFGGRVLGNDKPKYLNSPETPCFDKSQALYGLYELRQHCRQPSSIIVVEGYMDVIALAQHGLHNCIATLGTAATTVHIRRLFRETREIVFCFDGDEAGKRAAERAMMTALPLMEDQFIVKFLFLPQGEDPDSMVRKEGAAYFTSSIANDALPLTDQIVNWLSQQHPGESLDHRIALLHASRDILAQLPSGLYRTLLLEKISQHTNLASDLIERHLNNTNTNATQTLESQPTQSREPLALELTKPTPTSKHRPPYRANHTFRKPQPSQRARTPLIQSLIQTMLNDLGGTRETTLPDLVHQSSLPGIRALIDLHTTVTNNPGITIAGLMGHYMGTEVGQIIADLSANTFMLEQNQSSATLTDGWRQIQSQQLQLELNEALAAPKPDRDHIRRLLNKLGELKKKPRERTAEEAAPE